MPVAMQKVLEFALRFLFRDPAAFLDPAGEPTLSAGDRA
jgi:hypothetical protein